MTDGGEITLRCSQCGKGLAVVKVVDPHLDLHWRVRATCGYGCKRAGGEVDGSFWSEFRGRHFPGGFGVANGPEPEDMQIKCKIIDYVTEERPGRPTELTLVTKAC